MQLRKSFTLLALALAACGSDSLGDKFEKDPPDDPEGNFSPITKDPLHFFFLTSYRPDQFAHGPGTYVESSVSGHACIRVSKIEDTESATYADEPQTLVASRVKYTGSTSATDLDMTLDGDPTTSTTDAATLDTLLQFLWFKRLFGDARGHGYDEPANLDFLTRSAPRPDRSLSSLPFFDVRDFVETEWYGWESGDALTPSPKSFLNELYTYFAPPTFAADFFISDDFNTSVQEPTTCETHAEESECNTIPGCNWDTGEDACVNNYYVRVVWREANADLPALYNGTALHQVEVRYSNRGVLANASEIVIPDYLSGAEVPSSIDGCNAGGALGADNPCGQSNVTLYDDPFTTAPCEF
jgi:hypothetical protein